MIYTITAGDTLSKIASKFNVPLNSILSLNQIQNPNQIFVGQLIQIPNMQDIPQNATFISPTPVSKLIKRAKSVVNSNIAYKMGMGGMYPKDALPSRNGLCDCSGFVSWVLGLSRKTQIPSYKTLGGGWISTDSMEADIKSSTGIFEKLNLPEPGCIVVYGAGDEVGHVGLVSEVDQGKMVKVIHCSSGNSKNYDQRAIQETSPKVFMRPDALWGKFTG